MRVVVIGGTGHTGTYLVPRLVEAGYEVALISRNRGVRYEPDGPHGRGAWKRAQWVELDHTKSEAAGKFGMSVAAMEPDIVIDMICYRLESASNDWLPAALHLARSHQRIAQLAHPERQDGGLILPGSIDYRQAQS
jgi:nucleoside-diphosphate-sugar epimerase